MFYDGFIGDTEDVAAFSIQFDNWDFNADFSNSRIDKEIWGIFVESMEESPSSLIPWRGIPFLVGSTSLVLRLK